MEQRIPKIIHWCWFSGDELPEEIVRCLDSWRTHCPDWRIKKWDLSNFDVSQHHYTRYFAARKAWAYVSDYLRFDVLIKEGGVYLDSDIILMHSIDAFTQNKAFITFPLKGGFPPWGGHLSVFGSRLQAEMIGAVSGNIFIKKCLSNLVRDFHAKKKTNARFLILQTVLQYGIPIRSALRFLQKKTIYLRDFTILEQKYFLGQDCFIGSKEDWRAAYAIHLATGSWWRKKQPQHVPVPKKSNRYMFITIKRCLRYVLTKLQVVLAKSFLCVSVLCQKDLLDMCNWKADIEVFDVALYDRLKEPVHQSP